MLERKSDATDSLSSIHHHQGLDTESDNSNTDEDPVVSDPGEEVKFSVSQQSGVKLIEALHKHKCLEDHRVQVALGGSFPQLIAFVGIHVLLIGVEGSFLIESASNIENFLSKLDHAQNNGDLVDGLTENVSPHDGVDD